MDPYDLIKVYVAQINSSLKISKIICEHSDREELTGDDIICGLVYRLMIPMSEDEIQESLEVAEDILEGSEEEEEEEDIVEETLPTEFRKIKSNQCNCEICSQVRICLCNYENHEPSDDLANRFKDAIQNTCEKYKINITLNNVTSNNQN